MRAGWGWGRFLVFTSALCSPLLPRTLQQPWVSAGWGSAHTALLPS